MGGEFSVVFVFCVFDWTATHGLGKGSQILGLSIEREVKESVRVNSGGKKDGDSSVTRH